MSHRPTQRPAVSLTTLGEKKALGEPIVMVTAYDYPSAQVAEEAGVDVVLVGGAANVIAGAVGSSVLLSLVKTPVGFLFGAFLGTVALLLAALVIIRLMPDGISAAIQRRLDQRATLT